MHIRLALGLALVVASTACNPGDEPVFIDDGWGGYQDGNVSARLTGDMPLVDSFDDEARSGWFSKYDNWIDMGMEAYGDYGWIMLMVSADESDDGYKDVIGCSGPEDGYAEFDEPAVESTVEFEDVMLQGQDALAIHVTATFADGSTATAVGHVLQ